MDIMLQSSCLVYIYYMNPITVYSYDNLINYKNDETGLKL